MTLNEALEKIKQLIPYYNQYTYWKQMSEVWMKQCMEYNIPSPPQVIKTIDAQQVIKLYTDFFPDLMNNLNAIMKIYDNEFEVTTISDVLRFVEWDKTNFNPYDLKAFDCDDFAAHLWGNFACYGWSALPVSLLVGQIYGASHAICSVIACPSETEPEKIYFIEPQNDTIIREVDIDKKLLATVVFH